MANLLDQLKEMTVVVADTGDIQAIEKSVEQLKVHSDAFAALRMNRHIDHALKGTKLEDWSNSN